MTSGFGIRVSTTPKAIYGSTRTEPAAAPIRWMRPCQLQIEAGEASTAPVVSRSDQLAPSSPLEIVASGESARHDRLVIRGSSVQPGTRTSRGPQTADVLEDIVRRLDDLCAVADQKVSASVATAGDGPGTTMTSRPCSSGSRRGDERAALLGRLDDHDRSAQAR